MSKCEFLEIVSLFNLVTDCRKISDLDDETYVATVAEQSKRLRAVDQAERPSGEVKTAQLAAAIAAALLARSRESAG